jgi:hypothetical protein
VKTMAATENGHWVTIDGRARPKGIFQDMLGGSKLIPVSRINMLARTENASTPHATWVHAAVFEGAAKRLDGESVNADAAWFTEVWNNTKTSGREVLVPFDGHALRMVPGADPGVGGVVTDQRVVTEPTTEFPKAGVWFRVEWNQAGWDAVTSGRYPKGSIWVDFKDPKTGIAIPPRYDHWGLCSRAGMDGLLPIQATITAVAASESATAANGEKSAGGPPAPQHSALVMTANIVIQERDAMKEKLAAMFGLAPDCADEQVLEAVRSLAGQRDEALACTEGLKAALSTAKGVAATHQAALAATESALVQSKTESGKLLAKDAVLAATESVQKAVCDGKLVPARMKEAMGEALTGAEHFAAWVGNQPALPPTGKSVIARTESTLPGGENVREQYNAAVAAYKSAHPGCHAGAAHGAVQLAHPEWRKEIAGTV